MSRQTLNTTDGAVKEGRRIVLSEETLYFRLKPSRVKAGQVKETDAKILAMACENCHIQLNNLNGHYKVGADMQFLRCIVITDALVQHESPLQRHKVINHKHRKEVKRAVFIRSFE